jgi:hypothetical protein
VVVYTEREERARIVSAREATDYERRNYFYRAAPPCQDSAGWRGACLVFNAVGYFGDTPLTVKLDRVERFCFGTQAAK